MKNVVQIEQAGEGHWVGDGFPVRTIFSHHTHGSSVSPFLLLDYAGPTEFPPSDRPRGVETHPHKGFETVTIVYQGEVEHRDSTGGGGTIGPGDVQWMTAASGLVHEEMHGRKFAARGGTLEMLQLWVNLPARDKAGPAGYQNITAERIPEVTLAGGAGQVRVIAGRLGDVAGPARTFTPINVWDVRLVAGGEADLPLPDGHNTLVFVLGGEIETADGRTATDAGLVRFDPRGDRVRLRARRETTLAVLDGLPIDEPVAAYGPFVMNTREEIERAIDEYRQGRMGRLAT